MAKISISKAALAVSAVALGVTGGAFAGVPGYVDPTPGSANFDLTVDAGYISAADGSVIYMWGLHTPDRSLMQYPAPTLIVNEGDEVSITLTNCLDGEAAAENTSLIFPGFDVTATGGVAGAATREAAPTCNAADSVTYTFTADHAGTFLYQSGTNISVQSEMGLGGALIVRPTGFLHRDEMDIPDARPTADPTVATEDPFNYVPQSGNQIAYGTGTDFDYEYLYVLTDIDPDIHEMVRIGDMAGAKSRDGKAVYWMINGRAGPDTFFANDVPWLPTQPYGSMTQMQPGQKVLVRTVSLGRDLHPFHTHGNNLRVVAVDGNLLSSVPGSGIPDLGFSDFTVSGIPGQTFDGVFEWSDLGMGWDIFDEATQHPVEWHEPSARTDGTHGGVIPVSLPGIPDLTFGGFYSGSPYLGSFGQLPPGEGGLNLNGGFFYMWHSHNEKELVNNDIFPGGMMTMLIVEPFLDGNGDQLVIPRGSIFEKTAN
ncbi:multicopper oxidase domain-containing protein [Hyphomonas sp.]|uniref:multicopper oxidase domain-containing protein n=1 Tax=Hyphomonas sp. TaxID=87 RepID=UPI0035299357